MLGLHLFQLGNQMQIDLTSLTKGQPLRPADLEKLSSQMAEILLRLKATPGKPILVEIKTLSAITQTERKALLEQTPKPGAALSELLRNPKTQLVEMRFRNQTFFVLSDIALTPGQKISVTPKPDAFTFRQPQALQPTAQSEAQPTQDLNSNKPNTAREFTSQVQKIRTPTTTAQTTQFSGNTTPVKADPLKPELTINPTALKSSLANKQSNIAQNHATHNAFSSPQLNKPTAATPQITPPVETETATPNKALLTTTQTPSSQQVKPEQFIAQLLRKALPIAEPIATIKSNNTAVMEHIVNLPSLNKTQATSSTTTLWQNLNALSQTVITLANKEPPAPPIIRQALESQIQMVSSSETNTSKNQTQIQVLLENIANLSSQLLLSQTQAEQTKQSFSSLEKLLLSFMPNSAPAQATQTVKQDSAEVRLQHLQQFAQKALAQIQVRQIQNSSFTQAKTEQMVSSPSLSFDVPVRMPEGWFNLFVTIEEPKKEKQKKKEQDKSQRNKRWRLLLGLELGDAGTLTTELSINTSELDATLWADKPELREQAKASIGELRQQLTQQGLNVGELVCSEAPTPPKSQAGITPLIDIET